MEEQSKNTFGQRTNEIYSSTILDPLFEARLQNFDNNLRLVFDQKNKRWTVLEWNPVDNLWNNILVAEDREGNAKPLGEWVFNRLWVYRKRHEQKMQMGVESWISSLKYQAEKNTEKEEENISDDHMARLREDVVQWQKCAKELDGLPVSDATAGYPKSTKPAAGPQKENNNESKTV